MRIILNEHTAAEQALESHELGKKPFQTLSCIARYYMDNGYPKRQTRKLLEEFLLRCDPSISLPKWTRLVDSAMSSAAKRPAVQIEQIIITRPEMDAINSVVGVQTKRLAFTLLCLSKYWNIVNNRPDGWVNSQDSDIMRMANISTSVKRQSMLYHQLFELGYIRFSRQVDNTNVQVCFACEGEPALAITDFRNLGYQYLRYMGEPFTECINCGILFRTKLQSGRPRKYCSECGHEILLAQQREASRTYRHKKL